MASADKHGRGGDLAFVVGHDSKKFRLRAVSGEKDVYTKFIRKNFAKKVSLAQIGLALLVGVSQIVTMSLVTGRWSHDASGDIGAGIWSSVFVAVTALQTLWCLQSVKYWKLHLSFALHIICMLTTTIFLCTVLLGTIPYLKSKIGSALYDNDDNNRSNGYYSYEPEYLANGTVVDRRVFRRYNSFNEKGNVNMMIVSMVLNSGMAVGGLAQVISSFLMAVMTGKAICCGQSKVHGKLFELEIAGSENSDGLAVFRKSLQHKMNSIPALHEGVPSSGATSPVSITPPSYLESVAATV